MAVRALTPEERTRLFELWRKGQFTGLFADDPDLPWVRGLWDQFQARTLYLTPDEQNMVMALIASPTQREAFRRTLPAVALALAPSWVATLMQAPLIGPVVTAIWGFFAGVLSRGFVRLLSFWTGVVAVGWSSWLFGNAPKLAQSLGEAVAAGARAAPPVWTSIVSKVVEQLTGKPAPPEAFAQATTPQGAFLAALGLAEHIFSEFTNFIAPTQFITPEVGRDNAIRYLSANLTLNMTAWYLGLVHEMTSLGISRSLKDLPAQISWAMGLGWLSWLVFGAPFRAAIADPLEVLYNRTYRFTRLTPAQIVALRRGRWIDDDTYLDWLADHGWDSHKAWTVLEEAMAQPSRSDLERWRELGLVDEQFVAQRLRRLGYREEDVFYYLRAQEFDRISDELKALIATAEDLYRDGKVDPAWLEQVWDEAGLSDTEKHLRRLRLDLLRAQARSLSRADILDAFRDGALSPLEARARLRSLGYVDADIDLLLRREERRLSPAQILDAAIRGQISREEAIQRLVGQGYSEADARLLLSLRTQDLTVGQVLDALSQGLISPQQVRERLLRQGFRDEDVDLLVAWHTRRLSAGEVQAALLRGLLTEEEARARLRALGYAPEDVEILLALRFRLLSPGQVIDALLAGTVTFADALVRLQQVGYSAQDAELLLATAVRRAG